MERENPSYEQFVSRVTPLMKGPDSDEAVAKLFNEMFGTQTLRGRYQHFRRFFLSHRNFAEQTYFWEYLFSILIVCPALGNIKFAPDYKIPKLLGEVFGMYLSIDCRQLALQPTGGNVEAEDNWARIVQFFASLKPYQRREVFEALIEKMVRLKHKDYWMLSSLCQYLELSKARSLLKLVEATSDGEEDLRDLSVFRALAVVARRVPVWGPGGKLIG